MKRSITLFTAFGLWILSASNTIVFAIAPHWVAPTPKPFWQVINAANKNIIQIHQDLNIILFAAFLATISYLLYGVIDWIRSGKKQRIKKAHRWILLVCVLWIFLTIFFIFFSYYPSSNFIFY